MLSWVATFAVLGLHVTAFCLMGAAFFLRGRRGLAEDPPTAQAVLARRLMRTGVILVWVALALLVMTALFVGAPWDQPRP